MPANPRRQANSTTHRTTGFDNYGRRRGKDGEVVCFTASLRVHDDCSIGSLPTNITWRVGVVVTKFFVRCIAINHRVHVASGYSKIEIWSPQRLKGCFRSPVRLGNNPDSESLSFENPANNRHAKTHVIHISITGHNYHITTVPT